MKTWILPAKEKYGTVCALKTFALAAAHSANYMEIIIIVIADDDLFSPSLSAARARYTISRGYCTECVESDCFFSIRIILIQKMRVPFEQNRCIRDFQDKLRINKTALIFSHASHFRQTKFFVYILFKTFFIHF